MLIGVPKEIKNNEYRVGLTPANVELLVNNGHQVLIETKAGLGSGFADEDYIQAGAQIKNTPEEVYEAEMIVKMEVPQPSEYDLLKQNQVLFAYLHLAIEPELTQVLLKKKITAIAYETVETNDKKLPLLSPMSEVAGKMAVQIGANLLEKNNNGAGILLGGVTGVEAGNVTIIGAGIAGFSAAKLVAGFGANVTVIDKDIEKLRQINHILGNSVNTVISNPVNIEKYVKNADLFIGTCRVTGGKTPILVTEEMVKGMKKGSVIVDISIDQGGIVETIDRVTTQDNPTFEKYGITHYTVANIAGAVPKTSTIAITNATTPYILEFANNGVIKTSKSIEELAKGVNTYKGELTNNSVAEALELTYTELSMLIGF